MATHGWRTERPISTLGLALIAIGAIGVVMFEHSMGAGSGGFPKTGALAALGLLLGPWLLFAATRRGLILRVETTRRKRTLQVGAACSVPELLAFVEHARAAGLEVACDDRIEARLAGAQVLASAQRSELFLLQRPLRSRHELRPRGHPGPTHDRRDRGVRIIAREIRDR